MTPEDLLTMVAGRGAGWEIKKRALSWKGHVLIELDGPFYIRLNRMKPSDMYEDIWSHLKDRLSYLLKADLIRIEQGWSVWQWTDRPINLGRMADLVLEGDDGYKFRYMADPLDLRNDRVLKGDGFLHLIWLKPLTAMNFDRLHQLKRIAEFYRISLQYQARVLWYIPERLELPHGSISIRRLPEDKFRNSLIATLVWDGDIYSMAAMPWQGKALIRAEMMNSTKLIYPWEKHPELLKLVFGAFLEAIHEIPDRFHLAAALGQLERRGG